MKNLSFVLLGELFWLQISSAELWREGRIFCLGQSVDINLQCCNEMKWLTTVSVTLVFCQSMRVGYTLFMTRNIINIMSIYHFLPLPSLHVATWLKKPTQLTFGSLSHHSPTLILIADRHDKKILNGCQVSPRWSHTHSHLTITRIPVIYACFVFVPSKTKAGSACTRTTSTLDAIHPGVLKLRHKEFNQTS